MTVSGYSRSFQAQIVAKYPSYSRGIAHFEGAIIASFGENMPPAFSLFDAKDFL